MAHDTYSVLYENFLSQRCQSLRAFHFVPTGTEQGLGDNKDGYLYGNGPMGVAF